MPLIFLFCVLFTADLRSLKLSDILNGLVLLIQTLGNPDNGLLGGAFSTPIPFVGKSVNDLADYLAQLAKLVAEVENNPSDALAKLELQIEAFLGLEAPVPADPNCKG